MTQGRGRPMFLTGRFWWRMAAINATAAAVSVVAFTGVGWDTRWFRILEAVAVSFVFSFCISPFAVVAMAHLSPVVTKRFPFPLNWIILVLTLTAIAFAGTLLAVTLLLTIGYFPRSAFS